MAGENYCDALLADQKETKIIKKKTFAYNYSEY